MWELLGVVAGAIISNLFAAGRESGARMENFQLNEKAAQASDYRTRQLYNDLYSPKAQMSQIKEAGLSPSLFYSGGVAGGSGQSGAMGHGPAGISPTVYGIDASQAAQIDNIKADTRLKEAEAEKTNKEAGVVESTAAANVKNLLAQADAADAQSTYTKSQTEYQNTVNNIQKATTEAQIKEAIEKAEYMQYLEIKTLHEASQAETDADTKKKIQENIIEESRLRNANIIADTAVKQSQKKLNEQQRKNLINDIDVSLRNVEAIERQAQAALNQASNAEYANKIRSAARKDAWNMWKKDWELNCKKYELDKTDISYKYGKKYVEHIGNSYSIITSDETEIEPVKIPNR